MSMTEQIDLTNIIRRILKQWKMILMAAVIVALGTGILSSRLYTPEYETSAIIVVYGKNATSGNVEDARETAEVFQEIITSSLLQKKVAEVLEMPSLPGTISCENIPNTNMITLKVRAATSQNAMIVMNGVLDHYNEVAGSLLGDMVLQVLEEPKVPMQAAEIYDGKMILSETFVITAALICAVLFFYFYFRDDIKNEAQVEKKLDARLFASIYHEDMDKGIRLPFKKKKKTKILLNNPVTSFGYIETFNKLATKVIYRIDRKDRKTILVTSVQENEGKSTISANLAMALAKSGKKVLLVDLDLRKPAQYKMFEQIYGKSENQVGGVFGGTAKIQESIREIETAGIRFLGGSRSYKNAAKFLTSPLAGEVFAALEQEADYVILDTPPMYLTADAEAIMPYADAGILVVRQNVAKTKDINDAIDVFRKSGCTLLGCVMNDVETGLFGAGVHRDTYYHKYGYGYGYYKKKEPKETT